MGHIPSKEINPITGNVKRPSLEVLLVRGLSELLRQTGGRSDTPVSEPQQGSSSTEEKTESNS